MEYLNNWTSSLKEFKNFKWMKLKDKPTWDEIEETLLYLKMKNVEIDDTLLFDQSCNLNIFLESMKTNDEFSRKVSSDK